MSLRLTLWRLLVLAFLALVCLQLYFAARITAMRFVYPESTAFQRAQMYELIGRGEFHWNQEGVSGAKIHDNLRRAVIASEDADFVNHKRVSRPNSNATRMPKCQLSNSWAAPPSRSSWPKICFYRVSAAWRAKVKSWS